MNLSDEQMKFFKIEFDLSVEGLAQLSLDDLRGLREKCFDIEVEEATDADNEGRDISIKGEIAADLVDVVHKYIKSLKRIAV